MPSAPTSLLWATFAPATLESAVDEGIRLLEMKDHVSFVKNFALPEDLEKILKDDSITIEVHSWLLLRRRAVTFFEAGCNGDALVWLTRRILS